MTVDGSRKRTGWIPRLWAVEPPGPPAWNSREAAWTIGRYADIQAVLCCDDFSSPDASLEIRRVAERVAFDASALVAVLDGMMISQSGPAHRASRDAVTALMTQLMARWTRARIDAVARQLVGSLSSGTAIDLASSLVKALPNAVAADMLGIAVEDVAWLQERTTDIIGSSRPAAPLREYERLDRIARDARSFLDTRPREPSRIALPQTNAETLLDIELFLTTAAVTTTSGTLGGAIYILAQHLDLQQELRRQPDRVAGFVEEVLRLTSGVRRLSRRLAKRDVDVGGAAIAQGAAVILDIERAGRDASVYPEPETIELDRRAPATLAFGGGQHPCMGPRLARTEIASAVEALIGQFNLLPAGEPTFRPLRDLRQFLTLPIRLERRAVAYVSEPTP